MKKSRPLYRKNYAIFTKNIAFTIGKNNAPTLTPAQIVCPTKNGKDAVKYIFAALGV